MRLQNPSGRQHVDSSAAELVSFLQERASFEEPLSVENATDVIEFLLRRQPLAVGDDVASEVLQLLRAAQLTGDLTERVAGQPRHLLTAADLLEDARLKGEAERRVFDQPMVDAENAGQLLGSESATNRRQYANKQRHIGVLLGLPYRNSYLYPAFQFDVKKRRIRPVVGAVNKTLEADVDPWGVASWWITPSERLGGRKPVDVLGTDEENLVEALARSELEPVG